MRAIVAAACVAAAIAPAAALDAAKCAQETKLIYNSTAISFLTSQFFRSLNVSTYDTAVGPQPGHKRLRSELARGLAIGAPQLATLSGTGVESPFRKAFYAACEQINGGWCPQVNVSATWTSREGTKFDLESVFGMCFPFSCCDGDGCDMSGGIGAVASAGVAGVIDRWCSDGGACPNRTEAQAPLRGSAVSSGALGGLLLSGAIQEPERAALLSLSGRAAGQEPWLAEAEPQAGAGAEAGPTLLGGGTTLVIVVTNYCMASVFDTLMYVALGAAVVLCFCGCVVVGQRACMLRRAGLDFEAQYEGFGDDEEAVAEREARAARRRAKAEAMSFAFGSRALAPAASADAAPGKSTTAATASSSGSSGRTGERGERGSQASESLLAAAEAEGGAGDAAAQAADAEAPTDPISLETISEGEAVVQFPVCAHLFRLASLQQWLLTHDTCPVCRQAFPDAAEEEPAGAEADGDDAKAVAIV